VGAVDGECDNRGRCTCAPNVQGTRCDRCREGTWGISSRGCQACDCNEYGVIVTESDDIWADDEPDMSCDPDDGQCNCKELEDGSGLQDRINSRQCDGCYSDWYDSLFNYIDEDTLECTEFQCHPQGVRSRECHLYTGQCECREVYYTGIL